MGNLKMHGKLNVTLVILAFTLSIGNGLKINEYQINDGSYTKPTNQYISYPSNDTDSCVCKDFEVKGIEKRSSNPNKPLSKDDIQNLMSSNVLDLLKELLMPFKDDYKEINQLFEILSRSDVPDFNFNDLFGKLTINELLKKFNATEVLTVIFPFLFYLISMSIFTLLSFIDH